MHSGGGGVDSELPRHKVFAYSSGWSTGISWMPSPWSCSVGDGWERRWKGRLEPRWQQVWVLGLYLVDLEFIISSPGATDGFQNLLWQISKLVALSCAPSPGFCGPQIGGGGRSTDKNILCLCGECPCPGMGEEGKPSKSERRRDWRIRASGFLLSPKLRVRKRRGEGLMGVRGTEEKAKDHRPREIWGFWIWWLRFVIGLSVILRTHFQQCSGDSSLLQGINK